MHDLMSACKLLCAIDVCHPSIAQQRLLLGHRNALYGLGEPLPDTLKSEWPTHAWFHGSRPSKGSSNVPALRAFHSRSLATGGCTTG